jgi:methyl-accepting chemotaxis protein
MSVFFGVKWYNANLTIKRRMWIMKLKMNVRMKLFTGFGIVLILLLIISLTSITRMTQMGSITTEINDSLMPTIVKLNHISFRISNLQVLILKEAFETNASDRGTIEAGIDSIMVVLNNDLKEYQANIAKSDEKELFDAFTKEWSVLTKQFPLLFEASKSNDKDKQNKILETTETNYNNSISALNRLINFNTTAGNTATQKSVELNNFGKLLIIILTSIACVIGIAVAWVISYIISNPVSKLSIQMEKIAKGDLTVEPIRVKNRDEIGTLVTSFNKMIADLRVILTQVKQTTLLVTTSSEHLTLHALQTSKASNQISIAIEEVAIGTLSQEHATNESAKAMEEMAVGIQKIAESSAFVSESSREAEGAANKGNQNVIKTIDQMKTIGQTVEESSKLLDKLDKHSIEISHIIQVIRNIASQTNLLALNASIEAARAGEHGRGFAVVAGEIRKLAEQSSKSAHQIGELIRNIQADSSFTVTSMSKVSLEVKSGMELADETGHVFERILTAVHNVAEQVEEVSAASEQMSAGSEQISASLQEMSSIAKVSTSRTQNVTRFTQDQLTTMQIINTAAADLGKMAHELKESISKFNV